MCPVYNDQISQYITELFAVQDEVLQTIQQASMDYGLPSISVKPEEGRFLQFLVRACGAQKALEIGTLGGYSGVWIARGLPPGGKLVSLEREASRAEIARRHFAAAGLEKTVEVRVGEAHELLRDLHREAPFDFVFIDAEKSGYAAYLDWAMENIRAGGVIAAHNAFRKGSVAGLVADDEYTETMRAFNRRVAGDERLISTIFPAGDGMVVAVKNG